MQNLLLGLGTTLVAVAAVVFTAVNWSRLGATFQGLVLVALTAVAGAATAMGARKRLPATAEALGLVTLLLALADGHALRIGLLPDVDAAVYWAGALGAVSLGGLALGRGVGIRSTRVAAGVLAQLPVLCLLAAANWSRAAEQGAILAQVAVVLLVAARPAGVVLARRLAAILAGSMWLVVTFAALVGSVDADPTAVRSEALVLAGAAAVAAFAAWLSADDDQVRPLALGTASSLGLVAAFSALTTVVVPSAALAWTGLLGIVVVAAAVRVPTRWGVPVAVPAGVAAGTSLAGLAVAATTGVAWALEVASHPWAGELSVRASSVGSHPVRFDAGILGLHLLTAAVAVVATWGKAGRRLTIGGAVTLGGTGLLVLPILAPVSVGAMAAIAALASVVTVAVAALPSAPVAAMHGGAFARRIPKARLEVGSALALGFGAFAAAWGSATSTSTLLLVATAGLLALGLVFAARAAASEVVAATAAGLVVAAAGVGAGLGLASTGVAPAPAWAAAAAAAAVMGLVGVLLTGPDGDPEGIDGLIVRSVETVAWTTHVLALGAVVGLGDPGAVRVVLGVGVLSAGLHAARPGRRFLGAVSAGHAVVLTWLELGRAGVQAPEPYVAPLAAVLLAAGVVANRRARAADAPTELPSWIWLGPALVTALAPSLVVSLGDPGLLRPLVLLAVGAAVLGGGALTAKRAPVDVGAVVVVVIAVRQLAPVVGSLPNWATLGSTGLVLLAIGATFEQRRRDLTGVRHHYRSFR